MCVILQVALPSEVGEVGWSSAFVPNTWCWNVGDNAVGCCMQLSDYRGHRQCVTVTEGGGKEPSQAILLQIFIIVFQWRHVTYSQSYVRIREKAAGTSRASAQRNRLDYTDLESLLRYCAPHLYFTEKFYQICDGSAGIVIALRAGRTGVRLPERVRDFSSKCPDCLWGPFC